MPITLDRYLYLDADRKKVVEENDPTARFTLGGPGSVISDEDAKLYGLEEFLKGGKKATQPTQNTSASHGPSAASEGRPLGKAVDPAQNKGK